MIINISNTNDIALINCENNTSEQSNILFKCYSLIIISYIN